MLDLVWISYSGVHIDHDLQLYFVFWFLFIVWFWMCIWILCRCWEWACGSCETQRVAWRVIEVIAIYFGFWNLFWNGGWQQIKGVENGNFWKLFMHAIIGNDGMWIFLPKYGWYLDFAKVEISCSTSPPGGNQVDGLPPAFNVPFGSVDAENANMANKRR